MSSSSVKVALAILSNYTFYKVFICFDVVVVLVDLGITFPLCDCVNRPDLTFLISGCGQDARMLKPK